MAPQIWYMSRKNANVVCANIYSDWVVSCWIIQKLISIRVQLIVKIVGQMYPCRINKQYQSGLKMLTIIVSRSLHTLTHWGRDKMAAISQTTLSNSFSWMKIFEFRLDFHWSFIPTVQLIFIPALVLIMAWRRPGDKPLFEPMMVTSPKHICVSRPQWVNCCNITSLLEKWQKREDI